MSALKTQTFKRLTLFRNMMSQNGKAESIGIDGLDIEDISLGFEKDSGEPIDTIRSRVSLTRDATRAISP